MGRELSHLGVQFDRILCSSALRARQTLAGLEQGLGSQASCTEFMKRLYLASPQRLYEIISEQDDAYQDLALIGHNPGMEELAERLSGGKIDRMPTCCVARFVFEDNSGSWTDSLISGCRLDFSRLARDL